MVTVDRVDDSGQARYHEHQAQLREETADRSKTSDPVGCSTWLPHVVRSRRAKDCPGNAVADNHAINRDHVAGI